MKCRTCGRTTPGDLPGDTWQEGYAPRIFKVQFPSYMHVFLLPCTVCAGSPCVPLVLKTTPITHVENATRFVFPLIPRLCFLRFSFNNCAEYVCQPYEVSQKGIVWISCDYCQKWFHASCDGLNKNHQAKMRRLKQVRACVFHLLDKMCWLIFVSIRVSEILLHAVSPNPLG